MTSNFAFFEIFDFFKELEEVSDFKNTSFKTKILEVNNNMIFKKNNSNMMNKDKDNYNNNSYLLEGEYNKINYS